MEDITSAWVQAGQQRARDLGMERHVVNARKCVDNGRMKGRPELLVPAPSEENLITPTSRASRRLPCEMLDSWADGFDHHSPVRGCWVKLAGRARWQAQSGSLPLQASSLLKEIPESLRNAGLSLEKQNAGETDSDTYQLVTPVSAGERSLYPAVVQAQRSCCGSPCVLLLT